MSGEQDTGEPITELRVSADELSVRVEFPRALQWVIMAKPQAVQFAIALLQHCGVTITTTITPVAPVAPSKPENEPV